MRRLARVASGPRSARLGAVVLAMLMGSACASSDGLKSLAEESRRNQLRLGDLARATADVGAELKTVGREIETLRSELEAMRQASEGRERATREALDALRGRLEAPAAAIGALETAAAATTARIAAAESRLGDADGRLTALAGSLRGTEASLRALETSVRALDITVAGLADHLARLEAMPPAPPAAPPARAPDVAPPKPSRTSPPALSAEELFGRAMGHFRNGELGQAILDFEDFLAQYAGHPLAGSAQFWIGEAYFAARDFQHAAAEYQKAVDLAPKGEKTPEALFKLGLSLLSLKRADRARETWAQLIRDFPQSEAAQRARATLREASPAPRP
jgi:tol-pal system protein YbgF